jgi:hypothetical protein
MLITLFSPNLLVLKFAFQLLQEFGEEFQQFDV